MKKTRNLKPALFFEQILDFGELAPEDITDSSGVFGPCDSAASLFVVPLDDSDARETMRFGRDVKGIT